MILNVCVPGARSKNLTISYPTRPIECIANVLHRIKQESARVAALVQEFFERQLERLFLELQSAETLAIRSASAAAGIWRLARVPLYTVRNRPTAA
jgi:hypothetical protein